MSDVGKLVELIKEEGLVILPEVYSAKQCEKFVLRCEDLKNKLLDWYSLYSYFHVLFYVNALSYKLSSSRQAD